MWIDNFSEKQGTFTAIALIIILGFVVYANSLNGALVWDDELLVEDNLYIKDRSYLPRLFTTNIFAGAMKKGSYYRPIQTLSYAFDYSLWKLNPKGYHLSNIITHILVALSLFWFIHILFGDRLLSLLVSVLFLVHPIHTEAVAYISGRSDSLSALFLLLCFIFYIKRHSSKSAILFIFTLLSYALALLSRESSIVFPLLLLGYHFSLKRKILIKEFSSILGISLFYILLRGTLLKHMLPHGLPSASLFQRLPGTFVALFSYLRLLLSPFNLHMEYGKRLFSLADYRALLGIFMLFLAFFYIYKRRRNFFLTFSILWFIIALLPFLNLFPMDVYMAEHWLYLPSVGFFLILAKGLVSLNKTKNFRVVTPLLAMSLGVFYSSLTIKQNDYWKEPITFYKRTLRYAPDSARLHYNLGMAYNDIGKTEEAIASLKKAIEINPKYVKAYNNLSNIYNKIGKNRDAIMLYKKGIGLNPNYATLYYNLGNVYAATGETKKAMSAYNKAIEIAPDDGNAYINLGNLYKNIGKLEEAIASYNKAIEVNPTYAAAYYNLGNVYAAIGRTKEAIHLYKKVIEIDPTYAAVYSNLGALYADSAKPKEAITLYKKAIEVNPDYAKAHSNLAIAYYHEKQYDLAIKHCDKAIELGGRVHPEFLKLLKPYRRKQDK